MNFTKLKPLTNGKSYCCYDSEANKLYRINEFTFHVLAHLSDTNDIHETAVKFGIADKDLTGLLEKFPLESKANYCQSPSSWPVGVMNRITLHVSNDCNLRCKYCYASGGSYNRQRGKMDEYTATYFVDYCIKNFKRVNNIVFFGGEPFLNCKAIKTVCGKFKEKYTEGAIDYLPKFGAITNGTINSEEAFKIIKNHFSFLTVSVDGPQEINDANRVTETGTGSFKQIDKFLKNLVSLKGVDIKVEATYTRQHYENHYTHEGIRDFFKNEYGVDASVIDELTFSESNDHNFESLIPENTEWFHSFLKIVATNTPETKCPVGKSNIAVSVNGDIYPCHINLGDGMKPLSNIRLPYSHFKKEVYDSKKYQLKDSDNCKQCWAKYLCGGCSRTTYYNDSLKDYTADPNESFCRKFRKIAELCLVRISEIRTNPDLWHQLLQRYNLPG